MTTTEANVRSVIGTIGETTLRSTEYLRIDTMKVGEPGSSESATSQPRIFINIEQPTEGSQKDLRMGTVSIRPIYEPDKSDDISTEEDLEEHLAGYQVRVELNWINSYSDREDWPPFGIDYESLGFVEAGEDSTQLDTFSARTDPIPFEDAVDLMKQMVLVLREYREV